MSTPSLPSTKEQLEKLQQRALKIVKGLKYFFHWEKLGELRWTVQTGQNAQGHLIIIPEGRVQKKKRAMLFSVVSSDRTN